MENENLAEQRLSMLRLLLDIMAEQEPGTVKRALKEMSKREIEDALQCERLTDIEREILWRRYAKRQNVRAIADFVGYSERRVRDLHNSALKILAEEI